MNNYEYIIASLPVLQQDDRSIGSVDPDAVIEEIQSQLSERDLRSLGKLLDGYDSEKLCEDFYRKALSSSEEFIRAWFKLDLDMRNTRVAWINKALGRPENQDMIILGEDGFEPDEKVLAALEGATDLLSREKALDAIMWEKAEDLTQMHVFDLEVILGFIVRLKIIERWLKLDPETGRGLFRQLVNEIRNNK